MLSPWLRWVILAGIILFILAILIYIVVLLRKARKQQTAQPPASQAIASPESPSGSDKDDASSAAALPPLSYSQLKASFGHAASVLRARSRLASSQYQKPLFLVVGEPQSGKKELLNSIVPDLLTVKPPEGVNQKRAGVEWFFYDEATVLKVKGAATPSPDDPDSEELAWRNVLRQLESHWPDRPIDGVVLTISSQDLIAAQTNGSEGEAILGEKALAWYKRLMLAQKMLGMSFPVYVLVTKCDLLDGFKDFFRAIPGTLRDEVRSQDEMLGWSNPYPLASAFASTWMDEAFQYLEDQLDTLQLELFAEQKEARYNQGIFSFPLQLLSLHKPLSQFLGQVFRQSELHQTFALRGVYFCGDAASPRLASANTRNLLAPQTTPIFVRHLFERKVFVEQGLAQPISGVSLSRNRVIATLQVAVLLLLLVGFPGLYLAQRRLNGDKIALSKLLGHVELGLTHFSTALANEDGHTEEHEFDARLLREDSVRVRQGFSELKDDGFRSVFIPSSWFSPINHDLEESLKPAFKYIVFGSMRHDLDEKTEEILADSTTSGLPDFVQNLGRLTEHRNMYSRLKEKGGNSLEDLQKLLIYLRQPYFPQNLSGRAKLFQDSLAGATGFPLQVKDLIVYQKGAATIERKIDTIYQDVLSKGFFRNEKDLVLLFGYLDEIALTEQALESPGFSALASHRFVRDDSALKGLTLSDGLRELRSTLKELAGEKFMRMYESDPLPNARSLAGQHVMWDRGPLLEAIKQYEEFENFLGQKFQPFSENLQSDVQRKTSDKIRANLEQLLRQAKITGNAVPNDLQSETKSFKDAEDLLVRLADICAKLEMTSKYDSIVTRGVYDLLLQVNRQFLQERHYQTTKPNFSWWEGEPNQRTSLTAFELGSQEELAAYLGSQRNQIAFASRELAAPLIRFLSNRNFTTQLLRAAQTVDWAEINVQLERHEKMSPKSSVALLENFILEEMDKVVPGRCPKVMSVTGRTTDFFLRTRDQLRQQLYQQCYLLTDKDLFRRYDELQGLYDRTLAGKFPFTRIGDAQTFAEADPESIAEFYRLLDQSAKTIKDGLAKYADVDGSAAQAREFIERMEETREFLAPLLVKNGPPVADLEIKFRVNQGRELCGYQIIDWEFEVGREKIRYRDPSRTLRWRYGEPVRLALRWAKDSPSPPRQEGQKSNVTVVDRVATFEFTNRWALLAALSKQLAPLAEYDPVTPPDPHLLSFDVWTHDGGALLGRKDVCTLTVAGAPQPVVRVFVSVKLMPPGKKDTLIFPSFPTRAPRLDREQMIRNRSVA